jgi:hypothetical protein
MGLLDFFSGITMFKNEIKPDKGKRRGDRFHARPRVLGRISVYCDLVYEIPVPQGQRERYELMITVKAGAGRIETFVHSLYFRLQFKSAPRALYCIHF